MSEVISFRFNENNPDEAKALEILEYWANRGFSVREVIARALLELDGIEPQREPTEQEILVDKLKGTLLEAQKLLNSVRSAPPIGAPTPTDNSESKELEEGFKTAVLKAKKPGMKLE